MLLCDDTHAGLFLFLCLFDYLYLSAAGSASISVPVARLFFLRLFDVCLCLLLSVPKARASVRLTGRQTTKGKRKQHTHTLAAVHSAAVRLQARHIRRLTGRSSGGRQKGGWKC